MRIVIDIDDRDKRWIAFKVFLGIIPERTHEQLMEYVNKVNDNIIILRTSLHKIDDDEVLVFDYFLWIYGGVTRANIVSAFREFRMLLHVAGEIGYKT